jgi:septum site-determining protein MinD
MTRIICIASGKGGVGKTTLTSNLGTALSEFGKETMVIDANLTNANLGFHLGIPLYPKTMHDVLRGEAHITEALYIHNSGLRVIPAGLSIEDLKRTTPDKLSEVILDLVGEPQIILIDCAAGLGREALSAIESADETLIVTTPDLPSVTDALKTANISEQLGAQITGVVLNRITGAPYELTIGEVESMVGHNVIAAIPEDPRIREAIAVKMPIVQYRPNSPSAIKIRKCAADIAGIEFYVRTPGLFSRLFSFFRR